MLKSEYCKFWSMQHPKHSFKDDIIITSPYLTHLTHLTSHNLHISQTLHTLHTSHPSPYTPHTPHLTQLTLHTSPCTPHTSHTYPAETSQVGVYCFVLTWPQSHWNSSHFPFNSSQIPMFSQMLWSSGGTHTLSLTHCHTPVGYSWSLELSVASKTVSDKIKEEKNKRGENKYGISEKKIRNIFC